MRKIREILRLRAAGKSQHLIALSVGIGQSTVGDCLTRARLAGVSWPTLLDDEALERALYPPRPAVPSAERGEPDWAEVHRELKRKTLPPAPPRNPSPRLRSPAPAHSSRATSTSAIPRASSAWIHVPRPQSTEIASLRVHSRRSPPARTASCVPPSAHCKHHPPTHRPNALCPIVPRTSPGTSVLKFSVLSF